MSTQRFPDNPLEKVPRGATIRSKPVPYIVATVAIAFGFLGVIQPAFFTFSDNIQYTAWFLVICLALFWLREYAESEPGSWSRRTAVLLFSLDLLAGGYLVLNYYELRIVRVGIYTDMDLVMGAILIFLVMVSTLREYGALLFSLGALVFLYGYFGPSLPGILHHGGLGTRVITLATFEFNGALGFIPQAGARWIFIFLVLAGLMQAYEGLEIFMQIGLRAGQFLSSGVTQTAVISSFIIGSISGSAAANTALTGSFTIPLMKERGIDADIAGAIEAVASSGGQVMPPVMGIVAFIMADLLQVTYTDIILMAVIPGLMYYLMVGFSVHLIAQKEAKRKGMDLLIDDIHDVNDEIDVLSPKELLFNIIPFIAGVGLLVTVLVVLRWNPARTAFWSIAVLVGTRFLIGIFEPLVFDTEQTAVDSVVENVVRTGEGIYRGTMTMVPITVILAQLGIVVAFLGVTGLGIRMALQLVGLANIHIGVFLIALSIIIMFLGMGMPTIAAYLLTVSIGVPALTEFGFPAPAAHFFVLYVAILSNITPPVALTCAVASNIADGDFLATCKEAMKIGVAGFVLPFVIILNPSLILYEFPTSIVVIAVTFGALALLVVFLQNWGISRQISPATRAGALVVSLGLFASAIFFF